MILLTVGTQLPFDRLVRLMDEIAPSIDDEIIAQIGWGSFVPEHMVWHRMIEPVTFERYVAEARFIVSHAGIGSLLTAERHDKPIILFPRISYLGEHRNEHQMATATMISGRPGLAVASNEMQLRQAVHEPPVNKEGRPSLSSRDQICRVLGEFLADSRQGKS